MNKTQDSSFNGIINIDKPKGFTSHDVVAKLRGILHTKKIGHTGTLDPDATGVLPVCVGKGTKLSDMLMASEKEYIARVILGTETDTQDSSGTVLRTAPVNVNPADIYDGLSAFTGEISQIPPMYSAIKQNGKKLYELARSGVEVKREPRQIRINEIEVLSMDLSQNTFEIRVACSKGTYIRTLCNDIGLHLGCYGHMSELRRTKSGQFTIDDAYTLEKLQAMANENDFSFIIPIDFVLSEYPRLYLSSRKAEKVCHGMQVKTSGLCEGTIYRVYDESSKFLTLSQAKGGVLKILKTFY